MRRMPKLNGSVVLKVASKCSKPRQRSHALLSGGVFEEAIGEHVLFKHAGTCSKGLYRSLLLVRLGKRTSSAVMWSGDWRTECTNLLISGPLGGSWVVRSRVRGLISPLTTTP